MTRISPHLLVQGLDAEIVIMSDLDGAEIVVPAEYLGNLITAVEYFRDAFGERLATVERPVAEPFEQGIEPRADGTKVGRRLGKGRWSQ